MKRLVSFMACLLMIGVASAQISRATGIVVSEEDGLPVVGATVHVRGTSAGTVTDENGKFTLTNIPATAKTVEVSYLGMKTRTIHIKPDMKVVLHPDVETLDEVMVVAYGTTKKSSFTGSAATISAKQVGKLQVSNISKALEGSVPGVQVALSSGQPGTSGSTRIRGIGSINSRATPLYVVDGMPYDGKINAINPADIESMNVLKDAASTALYGSRAANGVILITTKKGAQGQKSKLTFEARVGVNQRGISEYDIMKSAGEYMTTYWKMLNNVLGDPAQASENLFLDLGYNPFFCDNNAIVDANGNLTTAPLRYNDNWEKEAIRDGMRQEYNLNIQGGSTKSSHFLSIGYLNDEGIITNSDYTRLSVRASGDYEINQFVKVNGSISYARGEMNELAITGLSNYANTFAFTQRVAPIYPVYAYDAEGNRLYDENGKVIYDFGDGTYGSRPYASMENVVASDDANLNRTISDNLTTRFGVDLKFLKDFKFQVNGGYDMTYSTIDNFMTPSFGDAELSNGCAYKYRTRNQTYTINELLNYNKEINGHSFDVLVGHENYNWGGSYLYAIKTNFFDPVIPEFNNAITMEGMESYTSEHTIESYLGRFNYDFNDKYYFSASVRRDGSSRFHKDNRWGTFWSVGGSWRISKENFMQDVEWTDNLTLRASYGSVGNDDICYPGSSSSNYYPYKTQYTISNSDGNFAVSKYYVGNKDLTWETSYNANIGLSATLFGNLLNVDFEYFNKKTEDMLYNVPQAMSSGISYISKNALTMTNKGVEFTLGVNIPMPQGMRWNWTFTGYHYKNEVTDIPEDKQEDGITHGTYYNIREGGSVYDFYDFKYAGVEEGTGKSQWFYESPVVDEEGNAVTDAKGNPVMETLKTSDSNSASKYFIGTSIPDFQGNISTEFGWKGFDFSISANYQIGGDIYDAMYAGLMHAGSEAGYNWHRDILGAWSPENPTSNIPILDGDQNANESSSRFLIDASYFNLRNITLGYTFPKSWLRQAQIENARLYFVADNIAIWSKRKGMDPRQYISGKSQANYSIIRSISVGLSLTL